MQTLISFIVLKILIRLLWPRDHTQLDMDFLLCLGRFFLSCTFSSIAQYEGADGQQPQKVECGSIWKLTQNKNKNHSSSFQFSLRRDWTRSIFFDKVKKQPLGNFILNFSYPEFLVCFLHLSLVLVALTANAT